MKKSAFFIAPLALAIAACGQQTTTESTETAAPKSYQLVEGKEQRLDIYTPYSLTSDLSHLSSDQKKMISLLIDASKIMDDLFWQQAFPGSKDELLAQVEEQAKEFTFVALDNGRGSSVHSQVGSKAML